MSLRCASFGSHVARRLGSAVRPCGSVLRPSRCGTAGIGAVSAAGCRQPQPCSGASSPAARRHAPGIIAASFSSHRRQLQVAAAAGLRHAATCAARTGAASGASTTQLTSQQEEQIDVYVEFLLQENEKYNLTGRFAIVRCYLPQWAGSLLQPSCASGVSSSARQRKRTRAHRWHCSGGMAQMREVSASHSSRQCPLLP